VTTTKNKKFNDIASINPENLSSKTTSDDCLIKYIDIESVNRGVIEGHKDVYFKDAPSRARRIIKGNDIIISTVRPYLRAFAKIEEDLENLVCSTGFAVVRVNEGIEADYVFWYVMSDFFVNQLLPKMVGANYPAVGVEDIKECIIPLPTLDDQINIAKILCEADIIIKKRKEAIIKLDELIKSKFVEMFGDPIINPQSIRKVRISEIGTVKTGNTPPRKDPANYGGNIEWIKSDNINTDFHYLTTAKEYLSEKGALIGRIVPKNSVLVTCIAGSRDCIGNVALTDRAVAFNQQINAIILNEKVNPYFLYTQLLVNKKLVQGTSTNSMKGMVSKSNFENIEVLLPEKNEQERFGEVFTEIYMTQSNMYKQLAKLEENFQALLHQAFTGQLQFRREVELICH
jgi:type I restriction enzyme S subunit